MRVPAPGKLLHSWLLAVYVWQRESEAHQLIARRLHDLTPLLGRLATKKPEVQMRRSKA
jgi:hypothetical protein